MQARVPPWRIWRRFLMGLIRGPIVDDGGRTGLYGVFLLDVEFKVDDAGSGGGYSELGWRRSLLVVRLDLMDWLIREVAVGVLTPSTSLPPVS